VKRKRIDIYDFVVCQDVYPTENKFLHIGYRSNNYFTFAFYHNDLNTPQPYPDKDIWVHWAGTFEYGENSRKMYRNGVEVARDSPASAYAHSGNFRIGSSRTYSIFDGGPAYVYVDNVMILTQRVLSAGDVMSIYSHCRLVDQSGLVLSFAFNSATVSATTVVDMSSNGNHGTRHGDLDLNFYHSFSNILSCPAPV